MVAYPLLRHKTRQPEFDVLLHDLVHTISVVSMP